MVTKRKASGGERRVAIIEGARTPFLRSGGAYRELMAYDLGRLAVTGLLHKTGLAGREVEEMIFGITINDPRTANLAREICLSAGLPAKVHCYMLSEACVSANQAIANAADLIYRGYADCVIAGGAEFLSDLPIRYPRRMRAKFMAAAKAKGPRDLFRLFKDVRPADFKPEIPAVDEFSTGLTMGQNADRLAKRLGIGRRAQDEYAVRSHQLSAKAQEAGLLDREVVPVTLPPTFLPIARDNGPRGDTSLEKMGKLKPAFDPRYGTVTAANASFLTDGASAVLLMSEEKAKALGLRPKAYLKAYAFAGTDPLEELLTGPAYAIPTALDRAGLSLDDIDVLEIHEAFAASLLAVVQLLESETFAKENLGRAAAVGKVDFDKLNLLGGSLSLGHPFGATGGRLITTCCNRLLREDKQFGLVAACGGGGCANATILERAD